MVLLVVSCFLPDSNDPPTQSFLLDNTLHLSHLPEAVTTCTDRLTCRAQLKESKRKKRKFSNPPVLCACALLGIPRRSEASDIVWPPDPLNESGKW